ncbi:hypothetical protein EVB32_042 [Rhizobium phage RHph_TM39]|uniref:Uncharacterized protein n=1 Tax=Rhizobium phage RHph_TM30 TaxID=2509764 RepID=A0A7S5REK0_9CAUD|nr:hypothetical protein PQC16_gp042 [Rhizobium phage RHph_TM30]QIG71513.1 hypothetical protein EVB94_042 [Rhizobium phage RHph_TM40]QIG71876.1 hypothetical protein EVB95_042 [Rhizobium phage RHph_TM2_3B]QIG72238.1 hypothetical protein EVB96_042 [Rhizobium phage RHph_TM3_3_6]QIG77030.1 hypothetical protein EVB32_042 [Rhizobium phage RHph_TM39]QIG77370.1 hypothetical protein EVB61_042 [Rhizobium phage RHph_TM21B]QIG77629.1 hypothetical protein EVB64_042 [Rhizobium phage RHph_TM61]
MHEFSGTFAWLHPDRQTLINMLGWLEDNEVEEPCITQYGRHLHTTIYNHGYEIFVPRKKLEKPIVVTPDQLEYKNLSGRFLIRLNNPTLKNYARGYYSRIPEFNMAEWESTFSPHMLLGMVGRKRSLKKPIDFPIVFIGVNSSPRLKTKADIIEEIRAKTLSQSRKNHIVKLMES